MNTPYSNRTQAKNSQAHRRQAPGDDGFQSLSVRITDTTLSPNDLTNRQEAMLLGEFFETPIPQIATTGESQKEEGRG